MTQDQQNQTSSNNPPDDIPTSYAPRRRRSPRPPRTPGALTDDQRIRAQKKFLKAYSEAHTLTESARIAGVNRSTIYEWQEHDAEFSVHFQQAKLAGNDAITEEIRRRSMDGWDEAVFSAGHYAGIVRKYDSGLLLAYAKSRMPEFRDKISVDATLTQGTTHAEAAAIAQDTEAAGHVHAFLRRANSLRASVASGTRVPGE
jgi:hypothetical protein